ncbi:MAG TPA: proteasome subunit alpha, partial [Candidatus Altiarchaeales archaeon]|nr:proteasome subunit alpha [Candidatus Altiarchaeales archaeon]
AIATSGLVADARRLVDEARLKAQRNRVAYNEPISVYSLTQYLCDLKQLYTQYGGARPFGAALLIAGINDKPYLFETDPSGAFTQYKATSIGIGKSEVDKILEAEYRDNMSRDEAIKLVLKALNSAVEEGIKIEHIEIVTIEFEEKFKKLERRVIEELFKEVIGK